MLIARKPVKNVQTWTYHIYVLADPAYCVVSNLMIGSGNYLTINYTFKWHKKAKAWMTNRLTGYVAVYASSSAAAAATCNRR